MNAKKDANELIFSFLENGSGFQYNQAKTCAIISCKHLIKEQASNSKRFNHWKEVLNELMNHDKRQF